MKRGGRVCKEEGLGGVEEFEREKWGSEEG